MKRIFLITAAVLTLFLSGCQAKDETDISAYSDDFAKAQEIIKRQRGVLYVDGIGILVGDLRGAYINFG